MRDRDTDFFGALFKVVFILVVSGFAVVLGLTVLEVVEVAKRRNDASSCVRWEATGALLCWVRRSRNIASRNGSAPHGG